jgi:deoxycytidylate deaminase
LQTKTEVIRRPELIFALVGPAGVGLPRLLQELKDCLKLFDYGVSDIRLSELLKKVTGWTDEVDPTNEYDRIRYRQAMGNAFRSKLNNGKGDGAALARAGLAAIRKARVEVTKDPDPDHPATAHAYIIDQLKHPAEVHLLRQVYGSSFILLAGHAPKEIRVRELSETMAQKAGKSGQSRHFRGSAEEIIVADEKQDDDLGQNTRDTYPLADFFANLALPTGAPSVRRFIDLLFGHPFYTPTPEEHAMYQANAVSLRSSDKSRQVGAVIANLTWNSVDKDSKHRRITNADVIASGMNEVPRGGGGFYGFEDSPDARDQALIASGQVDRAHEIKISALQELIEKIKDNHWLNESASGKPASQLASDLLQNLRRTQFMDIGEFMRPVHAEMAALIDGARRGVAVDGKTMYVTTFPCHNCAKHIIAAGLRKVVYLEPYPKSRADFLHREEISLESIDGKEEVDKVVFSAFSGIAPRQYRQLFNMSERKENRLLGWESARPLKSPPYVIRNAPLAYLPAERQELEKLQVDVYSWEKEVLCPTS